MLIYLAIPHDQRGNLHKLALRILKEGHNIVMPSRYRYELRDWCSNSDYVLLQRCDGVYFTNGWTHDYACQREMQHALNLRKQIFIEGQVEPR